MVTQTLALQAAPVAALTVQTTGGRLRSRLFASTESDVPPNDSKMTDSAVVGGLAASVAGGDTGTSHDVTVCGCSVSRLDAACCPSCLSTSLESGAPTLAAAATVAGLAVAAVDT